MLHTCGSQLACHMCFGYRLPFHPLADTRFPATCIWLASKTFMYLSMQKEWRKSSSQVGREVSNGNVSNGFKDATTKYFRLYACAMLEVMAMDSGNVSKVLTEEVLDAFRLLSHELVCDPWPYCRKETSTCCLAAV